MFGLAAGALGVGGGGGGVAVRGVAGVLEGGGTLLLLVGDALADVGGALEGAHQLGGGLRTGGERGRGVPLGLADRGGDPSGPVGGGAVAQHDLGGLPGGVQRTGVVQLAALGGGALLGGGQRQRRVPVGDLGGDQRAALADPLRVGDGVRGGGDLLGELGGAAALLGAAGVQPPGEGTGAAFGAGVHVTGGLALLGGVRDARQEVQRTGGEVALGGQFGAAAELVREAVHEVGEAVGVAGVGDGAQQQVGEVGVVLHREETGRLALVGVHLPLVAEEFGVQAQFAEVLVPPLVDLDPGDVQVGVVLAGLHQGVAEALHRTAAAPGPGEAFGRLAARADDGGLGDRQRVQDHAGPGAEAVPGLGELAGVVGDLPAAPFADLADDDGLAGEGVLPLQGDVAAVVGEQELAQYAGAGAAQGVAVTGQHHREDQLEQDGLAAAVLQEEDAGGGGAARWADRFVLEEVRLRRRRVGHGRADSAQVQHGVGVARTGGPDGVEADPGQLVHGGGLSLCGRTVVGGPAVGGAGAGGARPRASGGVEGQSRVGDQVEVVGVLGGQQAGAAVADRDDAQLQQFGHGGAARHVAHLELVAGGGAVGAAGVVAGALEEAGVDEEGDGLGDDAGGRTGEPPRVLGGAGGAAPRVGPPGGFEAGRVGGGVGVLALFLGALLQTAAGLPDERVDAVDGDPADVAVVGEVLGARERHGGDGEMGEAVQEAVGGVRGGAAGVVAHAYGEDGVLVGGDGHAGARRDLQDHQAEPGGDGVGQAREGGLVTVAAEQFAVLGVAGGQQLGLEPEGDEARGVRGVGGRHGRRARRRGGAGRGPPRVLRRGGQVPLRRVVGAVLDGGSVLTHARTSMRTSLWRRAVGVLRASCPAAGIRPPPSGRPPCPPRPAGPCRR